MKFMIQNFIYTNIQKQCLINKMDFIITENRKRKNAKPNDSSPYSKGRFNKTTYRIGHGTQARTMKLITQPYDIKLDRFIYNNDVLLV